MTLKLEGILSENEIKVLKKTHNLISITPKLLHFIVQTINNIPCTYEWAVRTEAEDNLKKDVENPLKTILTISWLCQVINQRKLTFNQKPIRIKLNDYLARHIWSFSLPTEHYTMCVNSLYSFYQETVGIKTEFLSPDQFRIYPSLKSKKPLLKGRQSSYLKVKEKICQSVENTFLKYDLYLPEIPESYNPLSHSDVNKWFTSVLSINEINSIEVNNQILEHINEVKFVCEKYAKPKNKSKVSQPVWISF
jgi:hypothetical protein